MSKATDSSGSLTIDDINRFIATADEPHRQGITLVAPSEQIAKEWSKQYPGCTILLSAKLIKRG
jgi:hypothetical protein